MFTSNALERPATESRTVLDDFDFQGGYRLARALIDRIECGLAAVTATGGLLHANLAARREFDGGGALRVEDGKLVCASPADHWGWQAAVHDAAVRQRSRLVWAGSGARRLMIVAMPLHVEEIGAPGVLLMLGRRSVCSSLGLEMLASHHGLTSAERRVFGELVGNQSTREIADAHGVAMNTVRTQVRSIREKMQVRSIDALLLRAAEVPPVAAAY